MSVVLKNMMTMNQQFSRPRYVSAYGLGLVLLCCREALAIEKIGDLEKLEILLQN